MKIIMPIITLFLLKSPNTTLTSLPLLLMILLSLINPSSYNIISSWLLMDSISISLLMLTIIMTSLILLSSYSLLKIYYLVITISLFLILVFSLNDLMMFYISFELTLIPTFFLILLYGKQPERLQASLYLLIYTISASLPLLLSIIIQMPNNCISYNTTIFHQTSMGILFTFAFLVKMPMFITHLWLPKAHVEAPLEGSMILAAVLLKLGGYGLIRFSPLIMKSMCSMSPWIMSISLLGALFTSTNCIRQKDMKALIAYSSVAHMALVICAIFSYKKNMLMTSMLMMISHGFSSSALFFMVTIMYNSHRTRNTLAFKGLLNTTPNMSFWWFAFIATNIAAPPTISFFSEILIFSNIINWHISCSLLISITAMTTATFSFMIYALINHSTPNSFSYSNPSNHKSFMSLYSHLTPMLLMMMKMDILY